METPRAQSKSQRRLLVLACLLVSWAGVIAGRLVYLQVICHAELSDAARSQVLQTVEIQARRGMILDRNGEPLAMSLPVESVAVNPVRIPDIPLAADILSQILALDRDELRGRMEAAAGNMRGFLWLKRRVPREQVERLRRIPLDYVDLRTETVRYYPKNTLAAHVLGGVDHEERGNAGIELELNDDLEGRPGVMRLLSDVRRRGFDSEISDSPLPGKCITLTIDERIQFVAERALRRAVEGRHCLSGTLVVMQPRTGEVFSLVSFPAFDPNVPPRSKEEDASRLNRAVTAPFEPGSVFKVVTVAAALETTPLRAPTVIPCGRGVINLFGRVIHDHDPYAALSMEDVLAKSSNIGAIQVGLRVGDARMLRYAKAFGFGRRTGIALPGEEPGRVRDLREWSKSSIGSVAMGHEVSVTCLQLAQAVAVVANGGRLVRPRLVAKMQRQGERAEMPDREIERRVLQPETAVEMRRMMMRVVLPGGTGTAARLDGWSSGGKTGTAQIYDYDAHRYTHFYNASFMGFAPAGDPEIVLAVTLNGAREYGGAIAAPVFREVAEAALRMLGVPKDNPHAEPRQETEVSALNDLAVAALNDAEPNWQEPSVAPAAGESVAAGRQELIGPRVPNFRGKTLRAVLEESAALGMPVNVSGTGIARAQAPPPGAMLPRGEKVRVQFAR